MTDGPASIPATPPPAAAPPAEIPALPMLWPGYVHAVVFFLVEVWEVGQGWNPNVQREMPASILLIGIIGWLYWLYCVYKFHDVMAQIPGYDHPITPWAAVGKHWIPFYNFYWVFKWPSEIATFVNWRTQSDAMKGLIPGLFVLVGFLAFRFVDGAIGMILLFSAGVYISRHLKRAFSEPPVPASAMARPGVHGPLGL